MNSTKTGNYRWAICALLFFATTINYIDRQVIGLLKHDLEVQFNWSESDYSYIVIAFSAAYALGLLAFGRFVDKIGTKMGYSLSLIIWSVAAMAHALAKSTLGFGIARASLGLGESGNFPAAIKAVAEWFPKKERAFATGIFNAGANLGPVIAPALVYWIAKTQGWQSAFIWTGAIGFIWLIFWFIFYDVPSKSKRLSKEEYAYIHSDAEEQVPVQQTEKIGWFKLFGIRQTWAFVFGKLLTDPVWWFFLFWLPSYLSSAFGVDLQASYGLPIIIIYTMVSVGSVGGGWLSSFLIKKGWPVFKARKTSMLIFAICVLPVMTIQFTHDMWVAVSLVGVAAAAHQAWSANIFTTVSDMFPKYAVSSVVGIGGMAGSIGGMLFPLLVGSMLDHYKLLGDVNVGYNILFVICGFAYLLAWVIMHFFAPRMEQVTIKK
ncbi:MFS transporter [Chitinophaga agrisoli]|uniref:MFS transporter n=1 Tax=Chitinophaga agrisoli TaxID=2607653 RepID=A0A5B2VLH3_9BACT|nr:MFS transporter [Chitinophaga agrisoli]KAA2240413.1 MFS transporter [Chitinophaga agrisoli]